MTAIACPLLDRDGLGEVAGLVHVVAHRVASSQAKSCSGTTATSGWSSTGTRGRQITESAYGATAGSSSSASRMVRAPRARISWIALIILSCSWSRPWGGTTQKTGSPSSISAMGPCLSSPAAKPSACM